MYEAGNEGYKGFSTAWLKQQNGKQMKRNHLNSIRPENILKYLGRQRNLHNIPRKIPTIQYPMREKFMTNNN